MYLITAKVLFLVARLFVVKRDDEETVTIIVIKFHNSYRKCISGITYVMSR